MSVLLDDKFVGGKTVKRDARGRVALGPAETAEQYQMTKNVHGQILLTPVVQIPEHEAWLWKNPEALAAVRRGLEEEAAGCPGQYLGSFAQYLDVEIDEE